MVNFNISNTVLNSEVFIIGLPDASINLVILITIMKI